MGFIKWGGNMRTYPLKQLEEFLNLYHPYYTINDVILSVARGYLQTTKPCDCKSSSCVGKYYHTISIHGVGNPTRSSLGTFVSPYKLWNDLHGIIPKETEGDCRKYKELNKDKLRYRSCI